jgi:hypothetical protein
MSQRDPALDHGGRLARFLDSAIRELKPVDDFKPVRTEVSAVGISTTLAAAPAKPLVNKFTELAGKVARSLKAMDARADRLSERLDKLDGKVDSTFDKHEGRLDQAESGMDVMDEALSGLIGHNGDPNDESKT